MSSMMIALQAELLHLIRKIRSESFKSYPNYKLIDEWIVEHNNLISRMQELGAEEAAETWKN